MRKPRLYWLAILKKKKKTWAKEAFVYCLFALTLVGKFNCLVPEPIPHRC